MLCSKCGANIPEDSRFCVHCGNKIEKSATMRIINQPAANDAGQPKEMLCPGCGAVLKPGARFCTKCGMKQEIQEQPAAQTISQAQPVPQVQPVPQEQPAAQTISQAQSIPQSQPVVQAAPQSQPSPQIQPAPIKKKEKSSRKKILIIIVILFLIIDIIAGAGYFYAKSQGKSLFEAVAGLFGSGTEDKEEDEDKTEEDSADESEEDNKEESDEPEEGSGSEESEEVKGDVSLLEPANALVDQAKEQYEAQNYVGGSIALSAEAMEQYITVAEENNLKDEAQAGIDSVYWIYADSLIRYCDSIINQGAYAAGFEQINSLLTDAMDLTATLTEKGYNVDSQELILYKDKSVQVFRDMYIESINNITKYDNWSRDEAWNYAEQAYSVKENGKPILFDEQDPEDPLRMRYVYCLAWVTRKRCETGLKDGSLSYADAVSSMEAILAETDYNLLLIQDIISYGSSAGMDVEKYRNAYNAVVDEIKREQGLTIGNEISVSSVSSVDLSHFWYFNDLDGEDKYKVDMYNGTRAATREWIRNNVPVMLNE